MLFGLHVEPEGASYDELATVAETAELAGYDVFARSDHYLSHERPSAPHCPTDAWLTMAALAERTSRVRLSVLMNNPNFRHPAVLAVALGQLDSMTDGRVELGVGAGWFAREAEAFGTTMPSDPSDRNARRMEQVEVMRGVWSASVDSPFSYSGAHYQLDSNPGLGDRGERPFPRLTTALSEDPASVSTAVELSDECNVPFTTVGEARDMFAALDVECERRDRSRDSLERSVSLLVCTGRSEAEIARRAQVIGDSGSHTNTSHIVGTIRHARDAVRSFADLGVDRVYVQLRDATDLDLVRLLAEDVLQPLM